MNSVRTKEHWLDLLLPIDPEAVATFKEATADAAASHEGWELLLEEMGRLLTQGGYPATAAVVTAAVAKSAGVGGKHILCFWEQACSAAFRPPPAGAQLDQEWLLQTSRAAVALHGMFSRLGEGYDAEDPRIECFLAGLEILARTYDRQFVFGYALDKLIVRLKEKYPRIARELSTFTDVNVPALSALDVPEKTQQKWHTQLVALCSELNDRIKLRATRGLALLSRIQSDNNRRILRPVLEAIESPDRLSIEMIEMIDKLSGKGLLDNHPLQQAAGGNRKITGTARTDTIHNYDELTDKIKKAVALRQKLEGVVKPERRTDDALTRELAQFIDEWKNQHVDASAWLLVRLLSADIPLVRSRLPYPAPSVLMRPEAGHLGGVCLYAIIEARTLVYCLTNRFNLLR